MGFHIYFAYGPYGATSWVGSTKDFDPIESGVLTEEARPNFTPLFENFIFCFLKGKKVVIVRELCM